jgi:hypothetical protein
MHVRLAPLLALASLLFSACASSPAAESAPPAPRTLYAYRIAVESVPAGAAHLALSLRLAGATSDVQPLSARGLVGNAAFEHDFAAPETDAAPAVCTRARGSEAGVPFTEITVSTAGRPLELELRLAGADGTSEEELARALASATSVQADGRTLAAPPGRLVRLR